MAPSKKVKSGRSCRICLSAKSEKRVTFSVNSDWARLLDYCFGVIVTDKRGPLILCGKCSVSLKEFADLKTLALKNDLLWNDIVREEVKTDILDVNVKDEFESDNYQDVPYLDLNLHLDGEEKEEKINTKDDPETCIPNHETPEVDQELKPECLEVEFELKAKKVKVKKDIPENLTQQDFIKKFFKVLQNNGRFKTKYECRNCASHYKRKDYLTCHVQKCLKTDVTAILKTKPVVEKNQPNMFYCGLCEFSSSEDQEVNQHVKGHCMAYELNCRLCEYVGRDIADIVGHRYKHMPQDCHYKYQCPACERQPKNVLTLIFHYRSDHLKKPGGWCSVCNKTFTGYKYYRNHERLHTAEKVYICDICGCKFLFKNLITRHMEEHMDVRNYVCDTCGRSFKRNNALTYHIRAFHVKQVPVTCQHCGKKFKNQYSLNMHMKLVRKGNNYICDVCSKGYPTLNLLRKHMFWHTGEKPYSCDCCGVRYKSKQILNLHKKKHAGYLPYKCDLCEKRFLSSYQLKVHMSVHTGIRRVKCLVCDKTFHEKKRMLEHCKSKHDSTQIKNESQCVPLTI